MVDNEWELCVGCAGSLGILSVSASVADRCKGNIVVQRITTQPTYVVKTSIRFHHSNGCF